jgi:hypothetical protein
VDVWNSTRSFRFLTLMKKGIPEKKLCNVKALRKVVPVKVEAVFLTSLRYLQGCNLSKNLPFAAFAAISLKHPPMSAKKCSSQLCGPSSAPFYSHYFITSTHAEIGRSLFVLSALHCVRSCVRDKGDHHPIR